MKKLLLFLLLITSIACADIRRTIYVLSNKEKAFAFIPSVYTVGDTVVVYFDYSYQKYKYAHNSIPFESTSMILDDFTSIYCKAVILK